MDATTATTGLDDWRVFDGDGFDEPMIFHRHLGGEYPAYLISANREPHVAQCSGCMQSLELVGTTPAASAG
jgi:hypothetical protein